MTDSEHEPVANTSKTRANKKTTRKQDIPQNRQIVTDKVVKRAMKQTGNKIAKPDVCPSNEDRDRQADINSCVLSSDEDLHVVDPVESFARICQVWSIFNHHIIRFFQFLINLLLPTNVVNLLAP